VIKFSAEDVLKMDEKTAQSAKDLREVFSELEQLVKAIRKELNGSQQSMTIKDFRRIFDQESAKMNQAIFNDHSDQIRETCLKTVVPLLEILTRS
jgi:hypothetical protein